MKVTLINPPFSRYGGARLHGGAMEPLNLCYLAAYARHKQNDVEFRILDSEIRGLSHEEIVDETVRFMPDLIGISASTCVFDSAIALTKRMKDRLPKVPVIIGGPHASALPELALTESSADMVAVGEGELTFEEVLSKVREKNNDWGGINGLAFRDEDGNIRVNPPRERIDDLDAIPFPARDLVDNNLYAPSPTKRVSLGSYTLLATSRGCPYKCGFCGAQAVWTYKIRARSPESVVNEIEDCIGRYNIRSFNFTDEFFTANKKRVLDICRLICERKFDIAWLCSARAQRLDSETLEAMKEAGCHEICFGIESGNQGILNRIDKSLDLDEARDVVRLTKKMGIMTNISYILGYIGETEETIKDTIRFAKELNSEVVAFFVASPLPGTPLFAEAREKGYLRPDARWADYSPLSNAEPVLNLPGLSSQTLLMWRKFALKSYYFRLGYVIPRLMAIRHFYEVVNLYGGMKMFFKINK